MIPSVVDFELDPPNSRCEPLSITPHYISNLFIFNYFTPSRAGMTLIGRGLQRVIVREKTEYRTGFKKTQYGD